MSTPVTLATVDPAANPGSHPLLDRLSRDLLTLGGLATACACVGLALNQMREQQQPLIYVPANARLQGEVARMEPNHSVTVQEPFLPSAPRQEEFSRIIDLEMFRELVQTKRGVVLDARPEIFHRLGHVPGALNLSREGFERDYAKQRAFLEPMRSKTIAVYCSSVTCEDSQMVADALTKMGYQHVLVFKGGWDEWTRAGLPEEHR